MSLNKRVHHNCVLAAPKSLPNYWALQGETTSHLRQDEILSPPSLYLIFVVSEWSARAGSSWLPPSHPHILSEMPVSKQQKRNIDSVFPRSHLIIWLPKWKFRAPSHHICSILRCFIALWEHEKASRKQKVHSFRARNPATKCVCKYKEKQFSPFTLW